jgi:NADH-quinone oxidoreductase subunit J
MIGPAVETVLFYSFAALAVLLAVGTIGSRYILRAAVCLMGVLALSSAFYVMLGADFLAGVQILVYVGGIVVLLVFAIMLTGSADLMEAPPSLVRLLTGMAASAVFLVSTVAILCDSSFPQTAGTLPADTTAALGRKLLDRGATGYVLPFEVISLLLFAAAVGGIVVARKTPPPASGYPGEGGRGEISHLSEAPSGLLRQMRDVPVSSPASAYPAETEGRPA